MPLLFSYGTLRQPAVQQALFGRAVAEEVAQLSGWRVGTVRIGDPHVVGLSGIEVHKILRRGRPDDVVDGAALLLSEDELRAADEYETEAYRRVATRLADGRMVFVYVTADVSADGETG